MKLTSIVTSFKAWIDKFLDADVCGAGKVRSTTANNVGVTPVSDATGAYIAKVAQHWT